jgi:alpha-L-fucosidase
MAGKVEYAQLLNDASEIAMTVAAEGQQAVNTTPGSQEPGTLTLTLPVRPPRVALPVIELFLTQ